MLPFADWLPRQRWFSGRNRTIQSAVPVQVTSLEPSLDHVIVGVSYEDGEVEHYQVFVAWDHHLAAEFEAVATIGSDGDRTGYDALFNESAAQRVVALIHSGAQIDGLRFTPEPGVPNAVAAPARVVEAEQSNTSVVFERTAILKVFRRIVAGVNPDIELNRVLARAGCPHTAPLLGAIEGVDDAGQSVSLAMLNDYVEDAADGWAMAETSARDLYAEVDLQADEVGGDFAAESDRLGEAVAVVHRMLADELGTTVAPPPVADMAARLDAAVDAVPELAQYASAARDVFEGTGGELVTHQRIHGDLHLGQALRTTDHWILIDFEGEPGRPMSERRRPDSPLRDVAGMLRSYEYAALQLLSGEDGDGPLAYRAQEWIRRNQNAFCDGYSAVAGSDPRDRWSLLRAYGLDKALYEAWYETRHRPSWRWIPLQSITRLLDTREGMAWAPG